MLPSTQARTVSTVHHCFPGCNAFILMQKIDIRMTVQTGEKLMKYCPYNYDFETARMVQKPVQLAFTWGFVRFSLFDRTIFVFFPFSPLSLQFRQNGKERTKPHRKACLHTASSTTWYNFFKRVIHYFLQETLVSRHWRNQFLQNLK